MNDNLQIFKEIAATLGKLPSRDEFVKAFKTAIEQIAILEKSLIAKIDTKQQQSDAAITDAINSLQPLKNEFRQAIKEAKDANETTFAAVRQRAFESLNALFTKMRLNEKFTEMMDEMMIEHEMKMAGMDAMIAEIPTKEETAIEIKNKLEDEFINSPEEDKIDPRILKGWDELKKQDDGRVVNHGVGGGGRIVQYYDLSASLNGTTTTFSLPSFWRVLDVKLSSAPVLRPTIDYTVDGSLYQITFTAQIDAATQLSAGQSLMVLFAES